MCFFHQFWRPEMCNEGADSAVPPRKVLEQDPLFPFCSFWSFLACLWQYDPANLRLCRPLPPSPSVFAAFLPVVCKQDLSYIGPAPSQDCLLLRSWTAPVKVRFWGHFFILFFFPPRAEMIIELTRNGFEELGFGFLKQHSVSAWSFARSWQAFFGNTGGIYSAENLFVCWRKY